MALRLRGATSGYIELKAPASAGDNTLTLPTNNGSANQLLKTDGSGNLSWVDDNSGVSLSGSTNNTIATVTGANALIGEANLTFEGTQLVVQGGTGTQHLFKHSAGWGGITSAGSAGGSGAGFSLANNYSGTLETKWSIYLDGATDDLRFTANTPDQTGDEKLRITSDGKVGIGTTSPTNNLHLGASGADAKRSIKIDGTNGSSELQGVILESDGENSRFNIKTGTGGGTPSDKLTIATATGNVGIGTSSPITKLNVNSGTTDLAAQLVSSDANVFLAFKDGDASGNQQVQIGGVGNNFVAFAGGDERFKIESTGRTFVKTDESTTGLVVQNTVHDSQLRIEASAANKNSVIQFADGADGDVGIIDYDHNDNSLAITVNTNERLRIESDGSSKFTGNITFGANDTYKIGTNSTKVNEIVSTKFVHRYGSSSGTAINEAEAIWYGGAVHVYHDNITCSSTSFLNAFTGNRSFPLILVHQEGSGAAINAEDGAITEGSDYRIKENITTLGNGIDKVKTLKPITYTLKKSWKPNGKGEIYHGFVAHEVSESLSGITGIVCGEKDAMAPELYSEQDELDGKIPSGKKIGDETGNMTTDMAIQGIDYGRLTPIITSALKEAIAKIETLETKVAALESA